MAIATIVIPGDPSVGIQAEYASFEFEGAGRLDDTYSREEVRTHLRNFFRDFFDNSQTRIYFDDECDECHSLLDENGECERPGCPMSNQFFEPRESD